MPIFIVKKVISHDWESDTVHHIVVTTDMDIAAKVYSEVTSGCRCKENADVEIWMHNCEVHGGPVMDEFFSKVSYSK